MTVLAAYRDKTGGGRSLECPSPEVGFSLMPEARKGDGARPRRTCMDGTAARAASPQKRIPVDPGPSKGHREGIRVEPVVTPRAGLDSHAVLMVATLFTPRSRRPGPSAP